MSTIYRSGLAYALRPTGVVLRPQTCPVCERQHFHAHRYACSDECRQVLRERSKKTGDTSHGW